jgi:hypothetical protein
MELPADKGDKYFMGGRRQDVDLELGADTVNMVRFLGEAVQRRVFYLRSGMRRVSSAQPLPMEALICWVTPANNGAGRTCRKILVTFSWSSGPVSVKSQFTTSMKRSLGTSCDIFPVTAAWSGNDILSLNMR